MAGWRLLEQLSWILLIRSRLDCPRRLARLNKSFNKKLEFAACRCRRGPFIGLDGNILEGRRGGALWMRPHRERAGIEPGW